MSDHPGFDAIAAWYATPRGRRVARTLAQIVAPALRRGPTTRLLAMGHPGPLLTGFDPASVERLAIVYPQGSASRTWPTARTGCACVADPWALPFGEALFDQALLCHALEFAEPPCALLRELWRVLAPAGEAVLIVPNRAGLWTSFEATPFGNGEPFGRRRLTRLLEDAMFEPVAWRTALVAPPVRGLDWLDRPLTRWVPGLGGIHFVKIRTTDGLAPTAVGAAPVSSILPVMPGAA